MICWQRLLTEQQRASLTSDLKHLNLSKYIQEVVSGVLVLSKYIQEVVSGVLVLSKYIQEVVSGVCWFCPSIYRKW